MFTAQESCKASTACKYQNPGSRKRVPVEATFANWVLGIFARMR